MHKHRFVLAFLAGTVSVLAISTSMAQEAATGGLEQITVTARKRVESMQDVPVAVAAISKTELENHHANSLENLAELAPQVSIGKSTTGTGATLTIRGISSAPTDAGLEQSVSMSIDGVSLGRGRIVQAGMFDMQQVEVMQGPQALFFGKNSPAGVISITSAEPTDKFEAIARAGYEFEAKERYGEAIISGPVSNTLKARLAFHYSKMDGWIKNKAVAQANPFQPFAPLPGATNGQHISPTTRDITGRATLIWEPADDFTAKLKVTLNNQTINGNGAMADNFCTAGQGHPSTVGATPPFVAVDNNTDCDINQVRSVSNYPAALAVNYPYGNGGVPYLRSSLGLVSLVLNKNFGNFDVTSTTGYYDQAHKGSFTGDFGEYAQIFDSEAERYRLMNEEIRINTDFDGPVNGMLGGYIDHSTRRWFNAPAILNLFNTAANSYASFLTYSRSKTDSQSVFGQLRWKIIPELELAAGARYSHDKKTTNYVNFGGSPLNPLLGIFLRPDGVPLDASYSGNNVSPDVSLTWKPVPDQTLYAAYKTGYKSGGLSNGALLTTAASATSLKFGPEKAKGFEVGYKAELFANTLRFDLVAYRYNYSGLQVTSLTPPTYSPAIFNAAKARTYGIQGSFKWMATDHLTLNGNIGWNKARYLDFPNAECYTGQTPATGCIAPATPGAAAVQNLKGRPLQRAPNVTFKVGADYEAEIATGWIGTLSASAGYSGSFHTDTQYSPGSLQKSYWLINAAVHLGPDSERYRLSVIGRNLTNSFYRLATFNKGFLPFQYTGFFNRPREVLVQVEAKF